MSPRVLADDPMTGPNRCPTPCDDDCDTECHEWHQPRWRRDHQPEDCPAERNRD